MSVVKVFASTVFFSERPLHSHRNLLRQHLSPPIPRHFTRPRCTALRHLALGVDSKVRDLCRSPAPADPLGPRARIIDKIFGLRASTLDVWIVLHDSRVVVARKQRHKRSGSHGRVRQHFSRASVTVCDPGLSSRPLWAVTVRWPYGQRSAGHVSKMYVVPARPNRATVDSQARRDRSCYSLWPRRPRRPAALPTNVFGKARRPLVADCQALGAGSRHQAMAEVRRASIRFAPST
jgi:hypothetical protein